MPSPLARIRTPLTPSELHAAWVAMRGRPCLRDWPQNFDEVMTDEKRSRCVAIEAIWARRRARAQPLRFTGLARATGHAPAHLTAEARHSAPHHTTDLKRAASGDRDDD
jgi:hypothetical protein